MKVVCTRNAAPYIYCEENLRDLSHCDDGTLGVVVYGYPYNLATKKWVKAQDFMSLYREHGKQAIDPIDGVFSIICLDRLKKRTYVFSDPYKIYTYYIKESKDSVIISTTLGDINRELNDYTLDEQGILEFLNFGFVLGIKTIYKGIETVPGGTIYCIDDKLNIKKEYYVNYLKSDKGSATKHDFYDEFTNVLATASSLSQSISLPLTGGLDSRTTLSGCLKFKEKIHCYTHGFKNSDDVKIASKISKLVGVNHSAYTYLGEDFVMSIPDKAHMLAKAYQGMLNSVLFSHLCYSYEQESKLCDTHFTGVAGGLYRNYYSSGHTITSINNLAQLLKRKITKTNELNFLNTEGLHQVLLDSILTELQSYNSDDVAYLSNMFLLKNRTPNFAGPSARFIGKNFNVFFPYLSKKLLAIILDIREKDLREGLQNYTIMQNSQQLANYPLDRGRVIRNTFRNKARTKLYYLPTFCKKATNKLLGRKVFSFRYIDYCYWLKTDLKDFVLEILDYDTLAIKSFFSEDDFRTKLHRFLHGTKDYSYFYTNMMTLQLYLQNVASITGSKAAND